MTGAAAFALAAALHLGFQATVTLLVYPALAAVAPDDWTRLHARHSRVIAPLVAVVYGVLLVATVALLLHDRSTWALVGAAGVVGTVAVTALLAAPLHGRLGSPEPDLLRRLLLVDRLRLAGAVVAAVGGVGLLLASA